ncbi:uncharacterized protein [Triticum aestivum]|uniref:uncharacterized protein n=1 Tax=Triticum aestivum TaxID=4565 RepID=UPI001D00B726|nr:uncharacterized protein LOC123139733 [Triticum aestivum]
MSSDTHCSERPIARMFSASQSPVSSVVCVLARKNSVPQLRPEERERVTGPPLILSSPNRISTARNLSSQFMAIGRTTGSGRWDSATGRGHGRRSSSSSSQSQAPPPSTRSSPRPLARPRRRRVLQGKAMEESLCHATELAQAVANALFSLPATAPSSASRRPPIAYPTRSMHYYVTMSIGNPPKTYFLGSPSLLDC